MAVSPKSKVFFFEKKKQKTFAFWCATLRQRAQRGKSFLVLFLKKEHSSSRTWGARSHAPRAAYFVAGKLK
jgi:hypothetical protein